MKLQQITAAILISLLSCLSSHQAFAEEVDENNRWRYRVIPVAWLTSLSGEVTARGFTQSVDVNFSDILEDLNITFQGQVEASKGKWTFFSALLYADLTSDVDLVNGRVDSETLLIELGTTYRVTEWENGSLELLGGGRYSNLTVNFNSPIPLLPAVDETRDWFDPFLGFRSRFDLSDRIQFTLRGDIGGFGVGSDFTWNASGIVGYQLTPSLQFLTGYKALYQDFVDGGFEWDVTYHGPILGISFAF
jgi:hypothetical protein